MKFFSLSSLQKKGKKNHNLVDAVAILTRHYLMDHEGTLYNFPIYSKADILVVLSVSYILNDRTMYFGRTPSR